MDVEDFSGGSVEVKGADQDEKGTELHEVLDAGVSNKLVTVARAQWADSGNTTRRQIASRRAS